MIIRLIFRLGVMKMVKLICTSTKKNADLFKIASRNHQNCLKKSSKFEPNRKNSNRTSFKILAMTLLYEEVKAWRTVCLKYLKYPCRHAHTVND